MKSIPLALALALVVFLSWRAGGTAEDTRLFATASSAAVFALAAVLAAASRDAGGSGAALLVPAALLLAALVGAAAAEATALGRLGGREIAAAALLLAAFLLLPPSPRALSAAALVLAVWAAALIARGLLGGAPGPLRSTFVNRNHFCAFLGVVLPLALVPALSGTRRLERLFRLLLSAVLAGGMVLTRSRGGLAALLFTLLCLWGSERRRRRWPLWPVALTGAIAAVLLAGALALTAGFPLPLHPPSPTPDPPSSTEISVSTRISLLKSTASIFLDRPLFGWGWGSFPFLYPRFKEAGVWYTVFHAHNEWLQIAAEGGIAGFALIALALVLLFRGLIRAAAEGKAGSLFARSAALSFIYAVVHASVEFVFRVPAISYLLAALGGMALSSSGGCRIGNRGWRRAARLAAAAAAVFFLILPASRSFLSRRAAARGFLLLQRGKASPAVSYFARAHDLDPLDYSALYGLARSEIALFGRAGERTESYARIESLLDRARAANPRDARTEWTRAAFLSRLGDGAGAEAALRRGLALDPSNPFFSRELARALIARGEARSAVGVLREAASIYPPAWPGALSLLVARVDDPSLLRDLPPEGARFRRDLAYALLARGRTGAAREEARRAAGSEPSAAGWLAVGRTAAAAGDLAEARDAYRRSLALSPLNPPVWAELGALELRRGEEEAALACYLTAAGISHTSLGPARAAGSLLLSRRGPEAALAFWGSLARRQPDWGYPPYARAEIFLRENDPERAEAELAEALRRDPENSLFLALQGRIRR